MTVNFRALALGLGCVFIFPLSGCAKPASPQEVSAFEVKGFKFGLEMGCKRSGAERGDSEDYVEQFCECMMKVLDGSLSAADWKEATYLASNGKPLAEIPAMVNALPKVSVCKNN